MLECRELLTGRSISFDSLAFSSLIGSSHLESGFAVSSSDGNTLRTSSNSWSVDQGTTMFNSSVNAFTTVSRPDGGNFQFVSIDLNSLNGNQPAVVPYTTTSDSGSVSNFSWTTDSLNSAFQTFVPASSSNLSSIRWQQVDQGGPSTDFHQFDNIILQVGPAITTTSFNGLATSTTPVDSMTVTLDETADLATFTHEDLVLTRDGASITLDASVTVSHISGTTYEISGLSAFTSLDGEYSLTVNALGVRNSSGLQGMGTSTEEWVKTSPPRVVATSFSSIGTLPAELSSLTVTFDQPVSYGLSSGALDPQNYELRRASTDGLLLHSDAAIQPSQVSISGNMVTLSFPVLNEDLWRLTIRDDIVNEFGIALDGDADGLEGGNWQDDFLVQAPVAASSVAWVRQFGTGGHEFANGISATAAGDTIVAGSTPGNLDGIAGAGSEDGFIRKLNSSGQHVWTRLIGSASGDNISDSTIDSAGNIYVVGNTSGTLPGQVSAGGSDAFLQKLDVNGNVIWTRQFGTISSDDAFALAVDGTGNVYVAGRTQGVLPGQFSSGSFDAFLRKYDSVGNVVWTSQFGSAGIDQSGAVSVDLNGDILVAGMTEGALPGQVSAGGRDIFVRRYHSSGAVQWTRQFGTSGLDSANGLDTDQYGAIYLSGATTGTFGGQLSLGGYDAIVQKLSPQGTLLWTRQFGTSASDSTSGILIDPQGSVVVSGTTAGSFPGQSNYGASDLFIQRFESDGDSISAWQYGSATDDVIASLATDAMGNLYAAGGTGGSLAGQTQAGGFDGLVLKFSGTVLETPDGSQIQVDPTGPGAGQFHASGSAALDGLNRLQIDGDNFFVSDPAYSLDDLQQTIVLATQALAGLDITREITVPSTGADSFVRTLDTFTNSSGSPRTASVRVLGNLASDTSTTVFATSSGDTVVDASDWWIGTDDGDGTGTPAIIHVIRGAAGLTPTSVSVTEDNAEWSYELNLGAGETQRLAYLTILGTTRSEAIAAAAGLVSGGRLSSEAAAYLTASEIESLANFQSGTLSATLDGSGILTISDDSDRPNAWTIESAGTDLMITDAVEQFASIPAGGSLTNGGRTLVLPASLVSGWLVLNTAGGNDSIEIDLAGGNLIPSSGISITGGGDESDELRIVGGTQGNVTYSDTDGSNGQIQMTNLGQISYSGISAVTNTGEASNVAINLPVTASETVLEDDGLQGNNLSQIRATSESNYRIAFTNPSGQLRIMPGTSSDAIQVSSISDFDASLQLGEAESPFQNIAFAGSVALTAGRNLTAFASNEIASHASADLQLSSADGLLELSAQQFHMDSAAAFSGSGAQISADRMDIAGTLAATSTVTLQPITAGQLVDLGSVSDALSGTLALSDAELDRITAGFLKIGSTNAGAISITQTITPGGSSTLHLISGAGVAQTAPIVVNSLAVQAAGAVSFQSSANDVDNVALRTTVGNIAFEDSDGFSVGDVNGVSGVSAPAGRPSLLAFTGDIVVTNTAAAIDVEGQAGFNMVVNQFAANSKFTLASGAYISGGSVQITADRLDISGTINAPSAVTLQAGSSGRLLQLGSGSDTAPNALELSDAELDRISTSVLRLGGFGTGTISITQTITPAGSNTLHLVTAAGVTQTSTITVANLAVQAAGTVNLSANNDVDTVALRTTVGQLTFADSDGFTIGTVNGVSGFSAAGAAAMTAMTGDVIVSNTPAANDLEGGTGFNMNVTLFGPNATFRIASGAHVSSSGAQITADRFDIAGTLAATSTVTLQPITAGQLVDLGSVSDALSGTLALSDAELDRITAGFLKIGSNIAGAISITQPITPAGSNTLHLISGAGITQTVSGSIAVSQLALQAVGSVTFDGFEDGVRFNQVTTLAGLASGPGSSFQFINKGGLTVSTANGITGVSANGGGVQITTHSPLTLNAIVSETGGGAISLIAGNDGGGDDHLTVNASVLASGGSGQIELSAGTDLILGAGTTVSASGAGTISVSAAETTALSTTASILAESGIISLETQNIVVTDSDPADEIELVPVEGSTSVELTINGITLVFSPTDESEPILVQTEDEGGQANSFPSANAGSDRLEVEGDDVLFGGSFTDADIHDTHLIRWDFGDGTVPVEGTLTPMHSYADNGVYTVTLTVTDAGGLRSEDRLIVTVSNAPAIAANQSYTTNEDLVLSFNVLSGVDNNGAFSVVDPGSADSHTAIAGTYATTSGGSVVIAANGQSLYTPTPGFSGTDSFAYSIQDDDGAVSSGEVTINVLNLADVSGQVFRDLNNDGIYQSANGETGIAGLALKLMDQSSNNVIAIVETDSEGRYLFDANLAESGHYRIERGDVSGLLDGRETVGNLGGFVNNQSDSSEIRDIPVGDPGETTDAIDYLFALIPSAQIQGLVWEDFNDDGQVNFGEKAIEGTGISLTGTDDRGNGVSLSMMTDAQGIIEFANLRPGNYSLTQTQSAGFSDGQEIVGTVNGIQTGQTVTNDQFTGIVMNQPGSTGANYNFAERPLTGAAISAGQTAGIGFWQNRHGQQLIKSLNGGPDSTALGSWLAATLPNMYGADAGRSDLTGKTNAQVAEFYMSLFKRNGKSSPGGPPKLDAQVLATALAVYVTNRNLGGTTAEAFGFAVSETGVGNATFDVGTNGAAFGVSNHATMTVLDVLLTVNQRTRNGLLFDLDGSGQITQLESALREMANSVFSSING